MAHETAMQWFGDHVWWIILWMWILGVFGSVADWRRKTLAARRRHKVEMEYARRGLPSPYAKPPKPARPAATGTTGPSVSGGGLPMPEYMLLPAAAIPAPPSARMTGPGPCRHEKIIPVIGTDGELHRWICANFQRCDAVFDKSVAIYEPSE